MPSITNTWRVLHASKDKKENLLQTQVEPDTPLSHPCRRRRLAPAVSLISMAKKKTVAGKAPADPDSPSTQPVEPEVDYGTPHTAEEEDMKTTTSTTNNAREAALSLRADQESSPRSSFSSSSSSEETSPHQGDSLPAMTPGELAFLLWTEETKANIRAIRQKRPPAPSSVDSAEVALTISRHDAALVHEATMVSEVGPVLPTPASAVDTSRSSSISATDVTGPVSLPLAVDQTVSTDSVTVARAAVQSAGGPQLSSANPQLRQQPPTVRRRIH